MSVAAPEAPVLIWPPYAPGHQAPTPAWNEPTRQLQINIPAPGKNDALTTTVLFEAASPQETDRSVASGLGALLAAEIPKILANQRDDGSMTWGVLNGRSGDAQNWEHIDRQPSALVRDVTYEESAPTQLDEVEIAERASKLAAAFARQPESQPASAAEVLHQVAPMSIPDRIEQTRVVGAEVARHRRPSKLRAGLLGAQLFMNRMIQRTIGGRGRHSAPGRNY